ncbi:MAG: hypothetical protein L6R28_04260 [Planctomycetes bacterium]|nr:hypothetical protein [Planctomycetota bacterium]
MESDFVRGQRSAFAAASLMLVTVPVALFLFWPQVRQIVEALEKLS